MFDSGISSGQRVLRSIMVRMYDLLSGIGRSTTISRRKT